MLSRPYPSARRQLPEYRADLRRSVRLFNAFRKEQTEPDYYYGLLADDTVSQLGRYVELDASVVLDVGGGGGYFSDALRSVGARVVCVDVDAGEMASLRGSMPHGAVLGSAMELPFRTDTVDVCFSSNVLEHVPLPFRMADEMVRVTRPGGTIYISYTNWLSPWGGHETSPWHYFGGQWAARRYQHRHGRPPKNRYGDNMYGVSIAAAVRWARKQTSADLLGMLPRYLPAWAAPIVRVPGLREFVTWNLVLVLRKR